jgi:DNA-binding beta-propeller fold protein YncE
MRAALFNIWLNRDFTLYAQILEKDLGLENWSPSDHMRLYIRKDVSAQLWDYGAPSDIEVIADPYEGKQISLSPDTVIGSPSSLNSPRAIAALEDSLLVADSRNNQIQVLSHDGQILSAFGSIQTDTEPSALLNEPWGLTVSPQGFIFVADTWNHRILKFSPQGDLITSWGFFNQGQDPFGLWGPRSIALSPDGLLLVADTGNHRIVVYDQEGGYVSQFGSRGFGPAQFSEPVGIAIDQNSGFVYVADTWNQRIQVFLPASNGVYIFHQDWDVYGWFGQSLDNKPYLAIDQQGRILVADPEWPRILVFSSQGDPLFYFGDSDGILGMASGVTLDEQDYVWVTDALNNQILRYTLP